MADIVRDGIEVGTFREVDPETVAEVGVTAIHGALLRRSTTDDGVDVAAVREELDEYLGWRLGSSDGR